MRCRRQRYQPAGFRSAGAGYPYGSLFGGLKEYSTTPCPASQGKQPEPSLSRTSPRALTVSDPLPRCTREADRCERTKPCPPALGFVRLLAASSTASRAVARSQGGDWGRVVIEVHSSRRGRRLTCVSRSGAAGAQGRHQTHLFHHGNTRAGDWGTGYTLVPLGAFSPPAVNWKFP